MCGYKTVRNRHMYHKCRSKTSFYSALALSLSIFIGSSCPSHTPHVRHMHFLCTTHIRVTPQKSLCTQSSNEKKKLMQWMKMSLWRNGIYGCAWIRLEHINRENSPARILRRKKSHKTVIFRRHSLAHTTICVVCVCAFHSCHMPFAEREPFHQRVRIRS